MTFKWWRSWKLLMGNWNIYFQLYTITWIYLLEQFNELCDVLLFNKYKIQRSKWFADVSKIYRFEFISVTNTHCSYKFYVIKTLILRYLSLYLFIIVTAVSFFRTLSNKKQVIGRWYLYNHKGTCVILSKRINHKGTWVILSKQIKQGGKTAICLVIIVLNMFIDFYCF